MYHDIVVDVADPLTISITSSDLTVTAGRWLVDGVTYDVGAATATLEGTDKAIYLDRAGGLVLSDDDSLGYGHSLRTGEVQELADLLAYRVDAEWHIKRVVSDA
jgi:hypothetical protein